MSGAAVLPGIDGAAIVVTGAAGGIGEGVARRLAAHGARLALIDREAGALEPVAADLDSTALVADIADEAAAEAAVEAASGRLGGWGR